MWLGGAVVRALDLRLEVAGSNPSAECHLGQVVHTHSPAPLKLRPCARLSWPALWSTFGRIYTIVLLYFTPALLLLRHPPCWNKHGATRTTRRTHRVVTCRDTRSGIWAKTISHRLASMVTSTTFSMVFNVLGFYVLYARSAVSAVSIWLVRPVGFLLSTKTHILLRC